MITFRQKSPPNQNYFLSAIFIVALWIAVLAVTDTLADRFSTVDKKVVDSLVKQWAPLVWLAPGEKFLPLDVNEFLENVHVHDQAVDQINNKIHWQINRMGKQISYTPTVKVTKPPSEAETGTSSSQSSSQKDRNDWNIEKITEEFISYNELFQEVSLGEFSHKSYLVTNNEIDELLYNGSSFLHGKDPNKFNVPIYAVVNICQPGREYLKENGEVHQQVTKQQFIPVTISDEQRKPTVTAEPDLKLNRTSRMKFKRRRRRSDPLLPTASPSPAQPQTTEEIPKQENPNEFMANLADNVKFTLDDIDGSSAGTNPDNFDKTTIPNFHVTYWMFYPYSQGKTMCTMNLGPLGRIPIPLIFGMCMGSKKDFGSHVGDWEHMSLFFRGSLHPDAMYVSAHDAGAYYSYNRLTGTFEFRSQETRKGILQRPNFPKTVITSLNHPVLFAALGSHGLWTAPGKHRFVRVPRLYDVNGFGTPWSTWKSVDITYENLRSQRSLSPQWFDFKGKWGNPKSKCHPLRRIGLNFCEYTDGPTGIPLKPAHFQCGML